MQSETKGYFYLAGAILFEALTFVGSEFVLQETTPLNFAIHFLGTSVPVLTLFYILRYKPKVLLRTFTSRWQDISKASFWFLLIVLLFFFLIDLVGSTSISLLEKFSIPFSALIGIFLLHEKVTAKEVFGIILCFIGGIILGITDFQLQLSTIIMGLSYAFIISMISYALKKYVNDIDGVLFNFYRIWLMTIPTVALALLINGYQPLPVHLVIISLLTGLAGIMGGAQFMILAHKHLPITRIHSLTATLPIVTAIAAYLVFSQIPSIYKITGGSLIIVGSTLVMLYRHRTPKTPEEVELPV